MPTSAFAQWAKPGKFSYEPLIQLNSITTRICSEIVREQIKSLNEIMQCNTEYMHAISHAKGFEEILNANARWVSKVTPQICQSAQQILNAWLESSTEYNHWAENEFRHATKETQSVQEKFTKEARQIHEKFTPHKRQ